MIGSEPLQQIPGNCAILLPSMPPSTMTKTTTQTTTATKVGVAVTIGFVAGLAAYGFGFLPTFDQGYTEDVAQVDPYAMCVDSCKDPLVGCFAAGGDADSCYEPYNSCIASCKQVNAPQTEEIAVQDQTGQSQQGGESCSEMCMVKVSACLQRVADGSQENCAEQKILCQMSCAPASSQTQACFGQCDAELNSCQGARRGDDDRVQQCRSQHESCYERCYDNEKRAIENEPAPPTPPIAQDVPPAPPIPPKEEPPVEEPAPTPQVPDADVSGSWMLPTGMLVLEQNGKSVKGSAILNVLSSKPTDGVIPVLKMYVPVEGTVTGNTFTGVWKACYYSESNCSNNPLVLTFDPEKQQYKGEKGWCGARPGVTFPDGCGFSMKGWKVNGAITCANPTMTLEQWDDQVKGTICNRPFKGSIAPTTGLNVHLTGFIDNKPDTSHSLNFYLFLEENEPYAGKPSQMRGNFAISEPLCAAAPGEEFPEPCVQ